MSKTQLQQSFESFDQLIDKVRKSPNTIRDKGTLFEYMAQVYLRIVYGKHFSHIWMLKEIPDSIYVSCKHKSYHIPHIDRGVDLVAQDANTGELVAIQAKFYNQHDTISKPAIDSFVAELGQDCYDRGIWFTSQDKLNKNATAMMNHTSKKISTVFLNQLETANINWSKFDDKHLENNHNLDLRLHNKRKLLRPYQQEAVDKAVKYYGHCYKGNNKDYDRGKLIMAPGTGKTFTGLNIAEALQKDQHKQDFYVLYLVPSIQLLTQTLFSWGRDVNSDTDMIKFAVTSDSKATKPSGVNDDFKLYPATTDAKDLLKYYKRNPDKPKLNQKRMFVVFSTYQSIDVTHQAQVKGFPDFDLIVADEAHRTAVYHKRGKEGYFSKVHSNKNVRSKLRLYQTATPKIYGEKARQKGKENSMVLCSMNDPKKYGKTFFRYTFGQAVDDHHLTDFRVIVLTINRHYIDKDMQQIFTNPNSKEGIPVGDYGKILGTINAMLKRKSFSNQVYGKPMKRAIAFATVNDNTKVRNSGQVGALQIANEANTIVKARNKKENGNGYNIRFKAVNGNMNGGERTKALNWLSKETIPHNEARVLSNVRFLGEGIDVPNLDAVIFFAPKQSQINIVQTVGRVMRKFRDPYTHKPKKWGYIILPIVIPFGADPDKVLKSSNYDSIWKVLNALRSVDERFDAEVNSLQFNSIKDYKKNKNRHIDVIGQSGGTERDLNEDSYNEQDNKPENQPTVKQTSLPLKWSKLQGAIYGEIVKHVGNRNYLSDWADNVKYIAQNYVGWIKDKLKQSPKFHKSFNIYLKSLRNNINDSINTNQAIEMISQHIITEPVFDALFNNNNFANNPVSKAMNHIVHSMDIIGFQKKQKSLDTFYKTVRMQASHIHSLNKKQDFIRTLYGEFFKKGFKGSTDKLGIVFTPVPIVNFIVHSVDYALHKYFDKSIASKGVNVLDPFVGTGTFITQTLYYLADLWQQHKIKLIDIVRNYTQELYCNEIVLLSYYIAAINIESVFNEIVHNKHYQAFKGIVLTDTFESTERDNVLDEGMFNGNNKRLVNEKNQPITVIMSNPPYSRGQKSANDNAQNLHYSKLEREIQNTYKKFSTSLNTRDLYNSYIEAIRWSSDRIGKKGIIGFVTDAHFLDAHSANGLRKCLYNEFNYLYIYNLRGNQRLVGDERKRGGAPVFGAINGTGGSKSPIAISILIKDGSDNHKIYYNEVKDYMSRSDKLNDLKNKYSIKNIKWNIKIPNSNNDWIHQGNPNYKKYLPLYSKKSNIDSIFTYNAPGVQTKRDAWVYGFSKKIVSHNSNKLINNYNSERTRFINDEKNKNDFELNRSSSYVKWTDRLVNRLKHNHIIKFNSNRLILGLYRPFTKKWLYYDEDLVDRPGKYYKRFGNNNIVIYVSGRGSQRGFSSVATNLIPETGVSSSGEGFMRYNNESKGTNLLPPNRDNINKEFADKLGLSTDNTFYYIYGILNSTEYREDYMNNLRKNIAHIPLVKNTEPFVKIGKKLMWLHIHYEDVEPYTNLTIKYKSKSPNYNVVKSIKHGRYHSNKYNSKLEDPRYQNLKYTGRKNDDLTTIKFNPDITIKDIPLKAYNYVVNGKAAIDWILDQYRVRRDKKSGIVDDPNKFSKDPKYIFNLLLRVINVSLKTVDLVNKLPKMQIIDFDWRKH